MTFLALWSIQLSGWHCACVSIQQYAVSGELLGDTSYFSYNFLQCYLITEFLKQSFC